MSPYLVLALTVALKLGTGSAFTVVPCDPNQGSHQQNTPPLPELPDTFYAIVEANIVQKHYSILMEEYYDYGNNRGATIVHRNGKMTRQFTNFTSLMTSTIHSNGSCDVHHISKASRSLFGFDSTPSGAHIKGIKDILYFGAGYGETYIGPDDLVRGVEADHWTTCLKLVERNMTFNLDYFFSKLLFNTSSGASRLPLRAVVKGTGPNGTFLNYYDFVLFQPGEFESDDVFKVPVGTYCSRNKTGSPPMPEIPDFFSTGQELTILKSPAQTDGITQQLYYDRQAQLIRTDYSGPPNHYMLSRYGNRPFSIIQDFNTSIEYIIDRLEENCTIISLPSAGTPSRDPRTVLHATNFYNISPDDFLYQGKKTWRGLKTDSWASLDKTTGLVTEVFFLDPTRLFLLDEVNGAPIRTRRQAPPTGNRPGLSPLATMPTGTTIVGIYKQLPHPRDQDQIGEEHIHFYGFRSGHPEADVFDVTSCYQYYHKYNDLTFLLSGNYDESLWTNLMDFLAGLRTAVATATKVSPTRITDLQAEPSGTDNELRIYFKLLDVVPYDAKMENNQQVLKMPSLQVATQNFQQSVEGSFQAKIKYGDSYTLFTSVPSSARQLFASSMSVSSLNTYTSGSMAGLGIGMLVIGLLLGFLGAYVIYRRFNNDIPYKITD